VQPLPPGTAQPPQEKGLNTNSVLTQTQKTLEIQQLSKPFALDAVLCCNRTLRFFMHPQITQGRLYPFFWFARCELL
jgi:hypothetical protein